MKPSVRSIVTIAVAILMILIGSGGTTADNLCGDVNQDGRGPDIGDICAEVEYLFISMPPIPQYRPAEIDGVYGVNILDLMALIDYVFRGGSAPGCVPSGAIDDGIGCTGDSLPAKSYGWLELVVEGNDLHVLHHYASANCCPAFFFDYYVEPGAVTVIEWDSLDACDCYCRFELESVVPDLDPGQYTVTVLGVSVYPYAAGCDTVGVETVGVGSPREF